MRTRMCGRFLLAALGLALLPALAQAQPGDGATNYAPERPQWPLPLYSERPESGGFFTGAEFVFMHQTRSIGDQPIALRGYIDSTGFITGTPGTYVGNGAVALSTGDLGRTTWEPGFEVFAGYRFANGLAFTASYMHLFDAKYTAGATLVPPFQQARPDLADTFLVSPVFNFPVDYAGPSIKTRFDLPGVTPQNQIGGSNTYGIWNAASEMTEAFTQRFDKVDLTLRIPLVETDQARMYALTGFRFAWFWESFTWRTVSRTIQVFPDTGAPVGSFVSGGASAEDVAFYSNVVSNRMYGLFCGCGEDWWIGVKNQFAISTEATGAVLLDIVKERAKYYRGDLDGTQNKRARMEYQPVPNGNIMVNLHWYPIEGIQLRLGYQAMMFFNTISSREPVDFNFGAIDPPYDHQAFRLVHGLNVGIGFIF